MAGECLVIALIIGILSIVFFRAKRKNWALAAMPLGIVPLISGVVLYSAEHFFKIEYTFVLPMTLIVFSLVVSCIWIGIASAILIKTKKMRVYYLVVSVAFVLVLSIIMLIRYFTALAM